VGAQLAPENEIEKCVGIVHCHPSGIKAEKKSSSRQQTVQPVMEIIFLLNFAKISKTSDFGDP
jgi:hypothetical protein